MAWRTKQGIELAVDEINASPAWSASATSRSCSPTTPANGVRASRRRAGVRQQHAIVAVVGHVNSGAMVVGRARVRQTSRRRRDDRDVADAHRHLAVGVSRHSERFGERHARSREFVTKLGQQARRGTVRKQRLRPRTRRKFPARAFSGDDHRHRSDRRRRRPDFEPYVSGSSSENADLVFVAGTDASGLAFLKEARRQQLDRRSRRRRRLADAGAESASGRRVRRRAVQRAGSAPRSAGVRRRVSEKVQRDSRRQCRARLRRDEAARAAVEKVGPDRAKIRDYLANLTERARIHGVTGTIRFRADGDPVGKSMVMTRVHQGALHVEAGQ